MVLIYYSSQCGLWNSLKLSNTCECNIFHSKSRAFLILSPTKNWPSIKYCRFLGFAAVFYVFKAGHVYCCEVTFSYLQQACWFVQRTFQVYKG